MQDEAENKWNWREQRETYAENHVFQLYHKLDGYKMSVININVQFY